MSLVRCADNGQNLWSQELWNGCVAFGRWVDRAEPVEELAVYVRATDAGARSLGARWLSLSGSVRRGAAMTGHAVVLAGGGQTGVGAVGGQRLARATTRSMGRELVVCRPEL